MSNMEIYNETVRDLLGQRDPKEGGLPKLEIRMLAEGVRCVGLRLTQDCACGGCECVSQCMFC